MTSKSYCSACPKLVDTSQTVDICIVNSAQDESI